MGRRKGEKVKGKDSKEKKADGGAQLALQFASQKYSSAGVPE